MAIPTASRTDLLRAIERFDRELRHTEEWRDWLQYASHSYAIDHNGRRYPVKGIIRIATGAESVSFNGGYEANSYVMKRGFTVVKISTGVAVRY